MHIDKNHLYHGAALIQIAEDPKFTSINELKIKKVSYRDVFGINKDSAVFLKYAGEPANVHQEFVFNFDKATRDRLKEIGDHVGHLVLGLVCVEAEHICCITSTEFWRLINRRITAKGEEEDQITILITCPPSEGFHVYVNKPGVKNMKIGKNLNVPRNAFPKKVFTKD